MGIEFEPGEFFVYTNGNRWELGMVKRQNNSGDGYFCWYSRGDTAANTPTTHMHKLSNAGFTHIEHLLDAATVGAGTCEPWDMRSNHAVQAANEQKVDERNTVPVTRYLMALDEVREASKDAERWERIARDRKSMCESLKETNADLREIIKRIKED